jgi:tRNA G10  N-methylase Trm11
MSAGELKKLGLEIKRRRGSVRLIMNTEPELSSAVVLNNKLWRGGNKIEISILKNADGELVLARTIYVQDLFKYTLRDRERPRRDARNGMLPPKLAQIMINLTGANSAAANHKRRRLCLDPFSGTGVVLIEALLEEYNVMGSDLNPKMVDSTRENLEWVKETGLLRSARNDRSGSITLLAGDAGELKWPRKPDFIVSETYLGEPYFSAPPREKLARNIAETDRIIRRFLENLHDQVDAGVPICLAVPAWFVGRRVSHLPLTREIEQLGYENIIDWIPEQVRNDKNTVRKNSDSAAHKNLIYHRDGQVVGRELLVLRKR